MIAGCGGDTADSPVVVVPPAVAVRQWSAPQLGQTSGVASVLPDTCNGINVIASQKNGWVAQRFLPTTGWQAVTIIAPASALDVQPLNVSDVPHLFYRDNQQWYRVGFNCATAIWKTSNDLAVEFVASTTANAVPTPIHIAFTETSERLLLAASESRSSAGIVLREDRGSGWGAPQLLSTSAAPLSGSVYVLRSTYGDVAGFSSVSNSSIVAFRANPSNSFTDVVKSTTSGCIDLSPRYPCFTYTWFAGRPRMEFNGIITIFPQLPVFPPTGQSWLSVRPTGLEPVGTLNGSISFPGWIGLLRADNVWQTYSSSSNSAGKGQILELDIPAAWTGAHESELTTDPTSTTRTFASPDTGHLATMSSFTSANGVAQMLAISDRLTSGMWAGTYSSDLGSLWANWINKGDREVRSLRLSTYKATASVQFIVGERVTAWVDSQTSLSQYDSVPFVLWK